LAAGFPAGRVFKCVNVYMCGICGIYHYGNDSPVPHVAVEKMMQAMAHRGPDDDGLYCDDGLCLGMRRLSIIDISTGKQPITNETGEIVIVQNGEIYNYLELRDKLIKKGHKFTTRSDTEVIVHLYEEYGTECFRMLNGMFGIALWDKRSRKLFLVRDRFGIKPLNYALVNGRLVFGSEIHLVLQGAGVSREIDPEALEFYLGYYYINAPRTLFKAVRKVPSASYLECSAGGVRIVNYWRPTNVYETGRDEEFFEERLRDVLSESVRLQLQSEVPLGVFLSGGLDSTSLVAFMRQHVSGRVKTFSIGFDDSSYSELSQAESVAKLYETEHYPTVMKPGHVPELLPKLIRNMGEPNGDWSAVANYLVSEEAKKQVTVVLRGDGGDEIFGGYPTYNAYLLAGYVRKIPQFIRNGIVKKLIHALPVSDKRVSFDFKAKRFIDGVDLPALQAHYFWKEIFPADLRRSLVSPEFRRESLNGCIYSDLDAVAEEIDPAHTVDALMYLDLRIFNQGCTLPVSDITSMAVSLEGRVPFLHNEVVDFAYSIPYNLKIRGMQTKYIFRKAMKPLLPPEIVNMKKKGFSVPGAGWIKNELKEYITDTLSPGNMAKMPFINPGPVQHILDDHFNARMDNTRRITCLAALAVWYDCFFG